MKKDWVINNLKNCVINGNGDAAYLYDVPFWAACIYALSGELPSEVEGIIASDSIYNRYYREAKTEIDGLK